MHFESGWNDGLQITTTSSIDYLHLDVNVIIEFPLASIHPKPARIHYNVTALHCSVIFFISAVDVTHFHIKSPTVRLLPLDIIEPNDIGKHPCSCHAFKDLQIIRCITLNTDALNYYS